MAKRGRPTKYTTKLAEEICKRLSAGESLRKICKSAHMPTEGAVRGWVVDDVGDFSAQYTRARNIGLDVLADEVLAIADGKGDVQRARIKFDARRWYLSKLAPKRYGDRVTQEHVGEDGGPVSFVMNLHK